MSDREAAKKLASSKYHPNDTYYNLARAYLELLAELEQQNKANDLLAQERDAFKKALEQERKAREDDCKTHETSIARVRAYNKTCINAFNYQYSRAKSAERRAQEAAARAFEEAARICEDVNANTDMQSVDAHKVTYRCASAIRARAKEFADKAT